MSALRRIAARHLASEIYTFAPGLIAAGAMLQDAECRRDDPADARVQVEIIRRELAKIRNALAAYDAEQPSQRRQQAA